MMYSMQKWKSWTILASYLLSVSATLSAQAPIIVNDPALQMALGGSEGMSMSEERELGQSVAKQIYRDPEFTEDAILQEYAEGILQNLLRSASKTGIQGQDLAERYSWNIFLIKDKAINAFAVPGGNLGLNLGTIAQAQNKDEVAAVLAHEMTHVSQRHIARGIDAQKRQTPLVLAGMILATIAASRSADAGSAIMAVGQGAAIQGELNFSREMEREADRLGLQSMIEAGYNPFAIKAFFEKLQYSNRVNDRGELAYLRSHPLTQERIADMNDRVSRLSAVTQATTLSDALIAARAKVLAESQISITDNSLQEVNSSAYKTWTVERQAAAWYAVTLNGIQKNKAAEAVQYAKVLDQFASKEVQAQRLIRLLQIEAAIANKEYEWAQNLLMKSASLQRPEALLLAEIPVRKPALDSLLKQVLEKLLTQRSHDAPVWQALAKYYEKQGKILRGMEAQAEAKAAHYDYDAALNILKAAREREADEPSGADKYIQASINDSKLKQFTNLRDRQREFEKSNK